MPSSADVSWLEVQLDAPACHCGYLARLLERRHIPGWVVECEGDPLDQVPLRWVFYLPQEPGWKERLGALGVSAAEVQAELRVRGQVKDEDWAENWKQFYHPRKLTSRLVIHPSWEEYRAAPGELVMELDPGMAFGTGYHASTRLCLELLEQAVPRVNPRRVLDFGTGSGILSIAALLLGAEQVTALDCDPVAVRVARANLRANRLSARARVRLGENPPRRRYDLVLANLVAHVLVELGPELSRTVGDRLILGGIVEERRDDVVEAYRDRARLRPDGEAREEGWVALAFRR